MNISRHDRAVSIACEHIRWAQSEGLSPVGVMQGFGGNSSDGETWDDAVFFVAQRWFEIDLGGDGC